jgi:hypothetical protein
MIGQLKQEKLNLSSFIDDLEAIAKLTIERRMKLTLKGDCIYGTWGHVNPLFEKFRL